MYVWDLPGGQGRGTCKADGGAGVKACWGTVGLAEGLQGDRDVLGKV